jgi:predicted XRE-type DNA-binding protein
MLMSRESTFTESSGNVFADLGLADADTRLAKAELARSITVIIQERGLTQREAARALEIDQPKVSAITRGRLGDFSLERLLILVNRLGMDIDIAMSPNPEPSRPPRMVVHGVGEALAASDTQIRSARIRFDSSSSD